MRELKTEYPHLSTLFQNYPHLRQISVLAFALDDSGSMRQMGPI